VCHRPAHRTPVPRPRLRVCRPHRSAMRVDLSWTASTGHVGRAGYRAWNAVKTRRSPAQTFVQIAIPTVSPSAIRLARRKHHLRYRVRATDGRGERFPFSTIVVATTGGSGEGRWAVGTLSTTVPRRRSRSRLFLPITGALPQTATATVRYRQTGSATWNTGPSMYRIRRRDGGPNAERSPTRFAWPIIDLTPGTSYDVEVRVNSGAVTNVQTLTWTRAPCLPRLDRSP